MKYLLPLMLFVMVSTSQAQSVQKQIDSLLQVAEAANDSVRLRIFNKVSFYYIFNDPPRAKALLNKGIEEARERSVPFSEAELVNTLGIYYDVSGDANAAKQYFEEALQLSTANEFPTITVMVINNLGMFHWNKGNYEEALDYFFQALKMNQKNSTDSADGTYLNNIGLIYQEMGMTDRALEYHEKALEVRERHNKINEIPISLSNIGINLRVKGKLDEAESVLKRAIETAKFAEEYGVYYSAMQNLGNVYLDRNRPRAAIPLYEEAIEGRNQMNIERRANLGTLSSLIRAYNATGNTNKALALVETGETFLEEFPDLKNANIEFYKEAAVSNFNANRITEGNAYFDRALIAKDSIFSKDNAEKIAALETRFNVAEKERDLAETRANLAERELEVKQKNNMIYGSLGLALVLALLGYLFYNQQKLKNRQLQKESELKTALAKIETQNRLQEQRLRISRDLHDNIGSQLTFIISSIDSLQFGMKKATKSTVEKLGNISAFTSQTIYELRDTIWAMNKNDITWEDLEVRISNFIDKARTASEAINFSFEIASEIDKEYTYSSVQGMNIYRIIQEAVNNALKYAEASEVRVEVAKVNSVFHIQIIDNGVGFDSEQEMKGNGLSNIKKRARDLEGDVVIVSEKGEGTNIRFTVQEQ
ncbi:tetratricopeptide repeat-containing sensor histidine kinase [Candidatus Ulvibacter alkanivorans]|uniref:tetratricopeptide repeat-containing sensor histidine kinase n=1 Tax=Candidatus Ulvibacter alkanivorans TaxID=2267620 RepID=UPI000DF3FE53|nr:tetratricopeptide repeat protein [Candidatus Ulvibacter alkanivorans]